MNVLLYRCIVCGYSYLEEESHANCPFCGAAKSFVVPAGNAAFEMGAGALSEKSLENAQKAIALEVDNAEFYFAASGKGETAFAKELFHTLAFVEAEHAKLLCKAVNAGKPEISMQKSEKAFSSFKENLEEARRREQSAMQSYSEFLNDASEPRVKLIFKALIEVEHSHLALEESELQKL